MKLKKKIKKMGEEGMYYIRIPKVLIDAELLDTEKTYEIEIKEVKE